MKQKKQNRILAALLAVAMMFQMLPMLAFAAEETELVAPKVKIGETEYETLEKAVEAATSGDTIILGEGVYSLGDTNKVTSKSLTFEGAGTDKTTWQIQAAYHGSDGWCDYSFDGSDSITFQDMTVIGSVYPDGTIKGDDLQGLVRVNNITLKNCVFNGRADYWGYESTTFDHVTFNAPGTTESKINSTNYSLWTYTGKTYTFRDCTFNSEGKTINVYRHVGPGYDVTVNFEDCTVNSSEGVVSLFNSKKTALNINDSNMGSFKYILNISGSNQVTAARDNTTCTQLFGFGGKSASDTGHTEVYIDNELVWGKKDGEPKGELKTHEHSDGVKDGKVTVTPGAWDMTKTPPEREVTEKCGYCNWEKTTIEYGYTLVYDLNGGTKPDDAAEDEYETKLRGTSDALAKAPVREGYQFLGWKINEGSSVYPAGKKISEITDLPQTGDITLTAQWEEITTPDGGSSGDGGSGDGGAGVVVAGALLGGAGYLLGTRLWLEGTFGFVPANRIELAMALWKRADCPAPVSTELYPDIDEDDTDAQAAARWCVEQDLMKDFARTNSDGTQTVKFKPYDYVFRPQSLVKWYKLEKLLNEQQSTNA